MDKIVDSHICTFNPKDNGGEALTLSTTFWDNGDKKNNVYFTQDLTLNSYGNSASFNLCGAILTPDTLRRLADDLEKLFKRHNKE